MHSIVIADTSCFILLTKITEIELLRIVYERVYTTPEVAAEFGNNLPDWIVIREVENKTMLVAFQAELDPGEASAIALTYELPDAIVVIDDSGARKVATRLQIAFTGTFGIILKAKQKGHIPLVKPILDKIKQTNFRISEDVLREILKTANEDI